MNISADSRPVVVVTGARGFLGRHVVALLARQACVIALARHWKDEPAHDAVERLGADLAGIDWLERLPRRVDAVVHLASVTDTAAAEARPAEAFAVNCLGTVHLLEYARRVGARIFVFASTGSVYRRQREPLAETVPPAPAGAYAFTKHVAEQAVQRYRHLFPTVILRFFHPYGPGQPGRMLVPRLVASLRAGRPIRLGGGEGSVLSFVYVDDAVEAVRRALALADSVTLNIAAPGEHSVREVSERLAALLGVTARYDVDAAAPENEIADTTLMQRLLGYRPRVALGEGLARVLGYRGAEP
ncbi:MAG TPA: NAD-dependent epimerase/dehydratase family protein [Methylomirabilota bacterium]|nr:NAD-dependent epimerase/dehydratase family protein [Methylomirabilota bacterium]